MHVYENKEGDWKFVLPMKPEGELSETELRDVAGGHGNFASGSDTFA